MPACSLKTLDLIFVTHLHSDHVLELGALVHTAWTAGLSTPVRVFGPAGTRPYGSNFVQGDGVRHRDRASTTRAGRTSATW